MCGSRIYDDLPSWSQPFHSILFLYFVQLKNFHEHVRYSSELGLTNWNIPVEKMSIVKK